MPDRTIHLGVPRARKLAIAIAISVFVLGGCASTPRAPEPVEPHVHPELEALAKRVAEPQLIRVSPRVHVAYAYDFANITFIEGDGGVIAIDAGWNAGAAAEAIAAYREQVSEKPIVALLYSHGHADHVGGAQAFVDASDGKLSVYGERRWKEYQLERVGPSATHFGIRAAAQMGLLLPEGPAGRVPTGGGRLRASALAFRYVAPTNEIDGETTLEIEGVTIVALPMPSETSDQLLFWLPEEKVAFAGDIAAGALPILSTPRNERGRVPTGFIDGIGWLLSLPLETLIAGHNPPVKGRAEAIDSLLVYRDASQFIFDQTMRALNANLGLEQAARVVQLPPHLAEHPLLRDHYHRLPWVVKGVYTQYGGWFQGDAATLNPVAPSREAAGIMELAGGADELLTQARRAYFARDYPWAAQLAGYLVRIGERRAEAGALKTKALRAMAYASNSGNERNYMLTQALAMEGKLGLAMTRGARKPLELMGLLETRELFRLLGPMLDPALCLDEHITAGFVLTDIDEEHGYSVRRGIGYYRGRIASEPEFRVRLSRKVLERIISNHSDWDQAIDEGAVIVEGPEASFSRFRSCFDGWAPSGS